MSTTPPTPYIAPTTIPTAPPARVYTNYLLCTPKNTADDANVMTTSARLICVAGDKCTHPQGIYIADKSPHSCANCGETIHYELYCADSLRMIESTLDHVLYSRKLMSEIEKGTVAKNNLLFCYACQSLLTGVVDEAVPDEI